MPISIQAHCHALTCPFTTLAGTDPGGERDLHANDRWPAGGADETDDARKRANGIGTRIPAPGD